MTFKQVHLAQGLILPSVPVEYMRLRAQGTGAHEVGLDGRSVGCEANTQQGTQSAPGFGVGTPLDHHSMDGPLPIL